MLKVIDNIFRKNMIAMIAVLLLSGCYPPIPFMETWCIPPITDEDFDDGGKVKTSTQVGHTIQANGVYNYGTTTVYDDQGRPYEISIPQVSDPIFYTTPGVEAAAKTNITIKNIIGQYYKGPSHFIAPKNGNYQKAVATGEFDTSSGKYIGKKFRIKNGQAFDVVDDKGQCVYVHGLKTDPEASDKILITISPADKTYYDDASKINSMTTKLNISKKWVERDKLDEDAKNHGLEGQEDKWYKQKLASKIYFRVGAVQHKIVGYGNVPNPIGEEDEKNNEADMNMEYSQTREKTAFVDGCLGLEVAADKENDGEVDVNIFVQVYKSKVGSGIVELPLSMMVVKCSTPEGCNPNYDLSQAAFVKDFGRVVENVPYDVEQGGKMWFKIDVPASEMKEYNGYLNINFETEKWQGAQVIYLPIIKVIKEKSSNAMTKIYRDLMVNTHLVKIVQLSLMIWLSLKLIKFVMGTDKLGANEMVTAIVKFSIAMMFVSESGYQFLNVTVFNALIGLPEAIISKMDMSNLGYSFITRVQNEDVMNPFTFMDNILALIFNINVIIRFIFLGLSPGGILVVAVVLMTVFMILRGFVKAFFIYVFAIMMIRFLLGISPFFAPLIVWENQTVKSVAERYWSVIFRFAMEPVILVIGLMVIASIIIIMLKAYVFNLQLCFKCMVPIRLDLGPFNYIPLISEITHALCLWGFMPWGVDNLGSIHDTGFSFNPFSGSLGMQIMMVRMLFPAIGLLILAKVYEGYIDFSSTLGNMLGFQYLSGGMGQMGSKTNTGSGAFGAAGAILGGVSMAKGLIGKGVGMAGKAVRDKIEDRMDKNKEEKRISKEHAAKIADIKNDMSVMNADLQNVDNRINQIANNAKHTNPAGVGATNPMKDGVISVLNKDARGEITNLSDNIAGVNNSNNLTSNELRALAGEHLERLELASNKNLLHMKEQMEDLNNLIALNAGGSAAKTALLHDKTEEVKDNIDTLLNQQLMVNEQSRELNTKMLEHDRAEIERLKFEKVVSPDKADFCDQQLERLNDSINMYNHYNAQLEHINNTLADFQNNVNGSFTDIINSASNISKADAEDKLTGINNALNDIYNMQNDGRSTIHDKVNSFFDAYEQETHTKEDSMSEIEKDLWGIFNTGAGIDVFDEAAFDNSFDTKFKELARLHNLPEADRDIQEAGYRQKAKFAWKLHLRDSGVANVLFDVNETRWLNDMGI